LIFVAHRHDNLVGEIVEVPGDKVGQLALVWLSLGMIDHMDIVGIGGSLLDNLFAIESYRSRVAFFYSSNR
jgi:hypothetical protein